MIGRLLAIRHSAPGRLMSLLVRISCWPSDMTVSRLAVPGAAVDCIAYLVAKEYHLWLLQKYGKSGALSRVAEMFVV